MLFRLVSSLLLLVSTVAAYKIVIFTTDLSNSQVLFNTRVAETLANANHNVTIVLIRAIEGREKKDDVKISKNVRLYTVNASSGELSVDQITEERSPIIFQDLPMWDSRVRNSSSKMLGMLTGSCDATLQNKEFLKWLVDEKFDIAFSHMYHTCPIGLIHIGRIPTWIWLNSGLLQDNIASLVGVPIITSYVPPIMMESTDRMNFIGRLKSFLGHTIFGIVWPMLIPNKETAMFRKHIGEDFPDLLDLAKKCPLVMCNSNELYEFPRPTLAKIVNIGGLGISFKHANPLSGEFAKISDKGEGMIIMSFGSVAAAHMMPEHWKESFLGAFKRFPQYQFIIRYEGADLQDRLPSNVYLSKWMPQTDLLKHPKTKAFISHGGYNSLQEVITAGIPMITIALFGDQLKNAKLAEAHGFSVNLPKKDISQESIYNAIKEVIENPSYSKKVKRLSRMVEKKPISAEHLLIKWTEFVAEFKTLENLEPAGQHLNSFQYYSLDVISFLSFIVFLTLFIVFKLFKLIVGCIFNGIKKLKQE